MLHSYPYRETSLIIDVLSRDHGRLALVAKGAKRPHSELRGVLQTFQPLSVVDRQVRSAHADRRRMGRRHAAAGEDALLCGFYVNELLVKFCAREDPHPELFDHYVVTLTRLAHDEAPPDRAAFVRARAAARNRRYGDDAIAPSRAALVERTGSTWSTRSAAARLGAGRQHWPVIRGKTLLDMEQDDYSDRRPRRKAKR